MTPSGLDHGHRSMNCQLIHIRGNWFEAKDYSCRAPTEFPSLFFQSVGCSLFRNITGGFLTARQAILRYGRPNPSFPRPDSGWIRYVFGALPACQPLTMPDSTNQLFMDNSHGRTSCVRQRIRERQRPLGLGSLTRWWTTASTRTPRSRSHRRRRGPYVRFIQLLGRLLLHGRRGRWIPA